MEIKEHIKSKVNNKNLIENLEKKNEQTFHLLLNYGGSINLKEAEHLDVSKIECKNGRTSIILNINTED